MFIVSVSFTNGFSLMSVQHHLSIDELRVKDMLDFYAVKYNHPDFITDDPISIPHQFSKKQDIEIAGFWTSVLSWGQRKSIIKSASRLMALMDNSPHQFVIEHQPNDLRRFENYCHRTFNYTDSLYFLHALREIYQAHDSLEDAFLIQNPLYEGSIENVIENFHTRFFSLPDVPHRTRKHLPKPSSGSRCKRLLMFLRWMVRSDQQGVDFGIWKRLRPDQLFLPLDVHVERSARLFGLLKRKTMDWKAVEELSRACMKLNPEDPVLYDFALFGLSVEKKSLSSTKLFVSLHQNYKTIKK